jgi:NADPH-dependent curcumin reductase CurA
MCFGVYNAAKPLKSVRDIGTFSEYQVQSSTRLFPIPSPKPEYLGLLVSGLTAYSSVLLSANVTSSDTVLVTAAAGGLGQILVQLAKKQGAKVIGTCSTKEKQKQLQVSTT